MKNCQLTSLWYTGHDVRQYGLVDGDTQIGQHLAQVPQINHSIFVGVHYGEGVSNLLACYLLWHRAERLEGGSATRARWRRLLATATCCSCCGGGSISAWVAAMWQLAPKPKQRRLAQRLLRPLGWCLVVLIGSLVLLLLLGAWAGRLVPAQKRHLPPQAPAASAWTSASALISQSGYSGRNLSVQVEFG